jgi:two-component system response regulator PrrA
VNDGAPAQVLVVDDDAAIRQALERALRLEGFAVSEAGDGETALDVLERDPPAAVVLDVTMPGIDGVEVTRRARARGDDVPILILSARDGVDDRVAGLAAGADDYLVKPFAMEELLARLQALLRRRPDRARVALSVGDLRIDPPRHRATFDGRDLDLTAREFELLEVLARHAGMVLTRQQLLEQVWGYTFDVQTNVVDVFVGYLRRKLEAGGDPRILHTVRGSGFVLRAA